MGLLVEHLRRHIFKCTTKGLTLLHVAQLLLQLEGPCEVTNFDYIAVFTLEDQKIFRLQVSMDKPILVHVVEAHNCLDKEVGCLLLTKAFHFSNPVKQVTLGRILEDQVKEFAVLQTSVQPQNVGMSELLVNGNLSSEDVNDLVIFDFVQLLDCHLVSCGLVRRQLHHSITTLANFSLKVEFIQLDLGQSLLSFPLLLACLGCLSKKQVILLDSLDFVLGDSDHVPLTCAVELVPNLPIFLTANVAAVDV